METTPNITGTLKPDTIFIRSLFTSWHPTSREKAMEYARWKYRAIFKGKDRENELLSLINGRLQGIQFTLEDLR